ncbi:SRPBCC domain-containing protein [Geodermatophilus sp. YIM 151500]|uniref:SRPBCC domain-containing protein n=1 Tax=Geodermatophilus sp. YIM 151500 TaxID=2984531 RepID=UPI0021E4DBC4|nr:SRPBCC domain-containing protein [Geodermatophilus sp. YIM 151500]MCV2490159.1 SRPBCC domain-containing protein [Geodermatophilus sp. YIM 151500]
MDETGTRRGSVTTEDDGRQRLEFRRTWPVPADDVWTALTRPDRLARWIGRYDGERAPGATGTFTLTFELEPAAERVTVAECVEQRRLVLEWPDQEGWRVELDLVTRGGGTTLVFVQRFPDATGLPDYATGWHWYLDKLDAEMTGKPQPRAADWDAFLAEVGPAYGRAPEG